jgi:hypothetical protein
VSVWTVNVAVVHAFRAILPWLTVRQRLTVVDWQNSSLRIPSSAGKAVARDSFVTKDILDQRQMRSDDESAQSELCWTHKDAAEEATRAPVLVLLRSFLCVVLQ